MVHKIIISIINDKTCEQSLNISVKYFENDLHSVSIKSVQAVILKPADVGLCLRISTSGECFQNLLRSNLYTNQILFLTSYDCIDEAICKTSLSPNSFKISMTTFPYNYFRRHP